MADFGEVAASRLWLHVWPVLPDAAKLDQALFTYNAELHTIRRARWHIFVILNPKALEWQVKVILTILNRPNRKPEDWHAAVGFEPRESRRAYITTIWQKCIRRPWNSNQCLRDK